MFDKVRQTFLLKRGIKYVTINKTGKKEVKFVKILHTADLHLASSMKTDLSGEQATARKNELISNFKRMADYAETNGISAFIIAGDLFDTGRVPKKTVRYITDCMAAHPDITFFYLCGNHDRSDLSLLSDDLPENIVTFTKGWKYIKKDNVVFAGRELLTEGMYDDLSLDSGDFNIVILHGQEIFSGSGGDLISIPWLAGKNIDYLALGHLHYYHTYELDGRGTVCYPGCPEGRGFDECGEKGFAVIDTEAEKEDRVTFVPFASRTLHEIHVSADTDDIALSDFEHKIIEAVKDIPDRDMVKVVLEGRISADSEIDANFLENMLEERFYFSRFRDRTELYIDPDEYSGDVSLKGELIRYLADLDIDPELKRDAALTAIAALKGEDIV